MCRSLRLCLLIQSLDFDCRYFYSASWLSRLSHPPSSALKRSKLTSRRLPDSGARLFVAASCCSALARRGRVVAVAVAGTTGFVWLRKLK